ncbi:MAG: LPS export ABC transporter periplasmic protein LptC [Candidatus Melainabacteria bacterium]|nr:LPS export ABC transporter periplasmic protein LptC [Candidatus Melainabacteria bacterium]
MNRLLLVGVLFLVLLAGGSAWLIWRAPAPVNTPLNAQTHSQEPQAGKPVVLDPNDPWQQAGDNVIAENVSFTFTQGSQKKWDILARQALYFQDNSGAHIRKITGTFYNNAGEAIGTFQAPSGEFRQQTKQVLLTGGVVVHSSDPKLGMTITAPEMRWSAKSDEIMATGGVRLSTEKFGQTTAKQCRFALDFSSLSLEGDAVSSFHL